MITIGSCSCRLTFAVSFVLINSVTGTRALYKQIQVINIEHDHILTYLFFLTLG